MLAAFIIVEFVRGINYIQGINGRILVSNDIIAGTLYLREVSLAAVLPINHICLFDFGNVALDVIPFAHLRIALDVQYHWICLGVLIFATGLRASVQ